MPISSDGDYYFIVDSDEGCRPFNRSTFLHFQTIAAADSPREFIFNENETYAVVSCTAGIINYAFDGLTFARLNQLAETDAFLDTTFDGDLIFGTR